MDCRGSSRNGDGDDSNRGGDGDDPVHAEVVRREKLLLSDAMVLTLRMIRIRMHRVLVVATSVHDTDLLDKAYHNLVVMMGHDCREQDHQHRQQVGECRYLPKHKCKDIKKIIDSPGIPTFPILKKASLTVVNMTPVKVRP